MNYIYLTAHFSKGKVVATWHHTNNNSTYSPYLKKRTARLSSRGASVFTELLQVMVF